MNSLAMMYESHFGLQQQPFSLTPNTRFYMNSSSHCRALRTMVIALDGLEGFIKIVGEVGTGKTLLCRKLINSLDDRYISALILNPMMSPTDLYLAFAGEIGLELEPSASIHQILAALNEKLIGFAHQGKRVLLIVDEAQAMPPETIEALRLLTNLETESSKLLQVVLFGQPELDNLINTRALRQLKQRITFQENLEPLDCQGVKSYLRHRMEVAGFEGPDIFQAAAVRLIHRNSGGIPRVVNIIAHKALLLAFGRGDVCVRKVHVRQAVADTESAGDGGWFRNWMWRSTA